MYRLLPLLLLALALPASAQSPCGTAVTVERGDTLAEIADRCATRLDVILDANPGITNPNVIAVGQTIDIPAPDERGRAADPQPVRDGRDRPDRSPADDRDDPPPTDAGERSYTVRSGDTLAEIAARFGVSVAALVAANAVIDDPARLQIGWDLRVPGAPEGPPRDGTTDPADLDLTVSTDRAVPGASVRLRASGFPARARVLVGAGPPNAEYDVVRRGLRADADGRVVTSAALPASADVGDEWVFVVATSDHRLKAVSDPIDVVREAPGGEAPPEDGRVVVRGQLTDEGVECPALRAQDGQLYTLAGDTGRFGPGDRVRAEGRVAEVSTCMQGTTLALDRLMVWKDADAPDDDRGGTLRPVHRIEGTLVRATECPAVRTDDGTLFTLAGGGDRFAAGTRVRVEGVEAEVSYCQEGTTLAVREIEPVR